MKVVFTISMMTLVLILLALILEPSIIKNKKKALIMITLVALSSILMAISFPKLISTPIAEQNINKETEQDQEISEEAEVEKVYITDDDMIVLNKNYRDMNSMERDIVEDVVRKIEDVEEGMIKEVAYRRLEELVVEKEQFEESERIAIEKEKEDRKKQDEIDRAAQIEAEKEKYNTGITWEDMARDKDGRKGEYVRLKGKVIQVINGDTHNQYRLAVDSDYDKVVLIGINHDLLTSNILDGDMITVEGMSVGNIEYETTMGSKLSVPGLVVNNIIR